MKHKADMVGFVPGIVFIIMGFAYSSNGVWMLGLIFLGPGVYESANKTKVRSD